MIIPKFERNALSSSWQEYYNEAQEEDLQFGTKIGEDLRSNNEAWENLSQMLIEKEICPNGYLSLGSGVRPWLKEYFNILNLQEAKDHLNKIVLVDYAFAARNHAQKFPEFVQNHLNTQYPQFKKSGLSFDVKAIGGDVLVKVPEIADTLPSNLFLEIRSLLSYLPEEPFLQMFSEFLLPKTDVLVVVQEQVNDLRPFFDTKAIKDCRILDNILAEHGFHSVYRSPIPPNRVEVDFGGIFIKY
jgi:hypothetical protein